VPPETGKAGLFDHLLRHFLADVGLGQLGDLAHAGQLHLFGDLARAAVQGSCRYEDANCPLPGACWPAI